MNPFRSAAGVCGVAVLLSFPAAALEPGRLVTELEREVWGPSQGLPQNTVNAVVQTRDGYLWLGTYGGLSRFDGVRFVTFQPETTPGLTDNRIRALVEDEEGDLWIGTDNGVSRLSRGRATAYRKEDGLSSPQVVCLAAERGGTIWVGTNGGLDRIRSGRFDAAALPGIVRGKRIMALLVDRERALWASVTGVGVVRIKDGNAAVLDDARGDPPSEVTAFTQDASGALWAGRRDSTILRLAADRFETVARLEGGRQVTALRRDHDGSFWIATYGAGLVRLRDGAQDRLTLREGLPNDAVQAICEDHEGSLWLGTYSGLGRLRHSSFSAITTREGLIQSYVKCVFADAAGDVWAGGFDGALSRIRAGRVIGVFGRAEGLPNDVIRSISQAADGALLLGFGSSGLMRFEPDGHRPPTRLDGLPFPLVNSIVPGEGGRLWVGTMGGACEIDGAQRTVFSSRSGFPIDRVGPILPGRDGTVWLGTFGAGLIELRNGSVEKVHGMADGLSSETVLSLLEDERGDVWIGDSVGGLARMRGGRVRSYRAAIASGNAAIVEILRDDLGFLWLGTPLGIVRVRRDDVDAYDAGRITTIPTAVYGTADGMPSRECSGGSSHTATRTKDGRLWFATDRGVAIVDPARLSVNARVPPMAVEEVLVDGAPLALGTSGEAVLPAGAGKLEIHYTALSLLAPERVRFRYSMEGWETTRTDAETRRTAYYTNVPPGRYRFRVVACNNDGVWNEAGATLLVRALPRFHQTTWFRTLVGLAAGGLALAAYRFRIRVLREREAELVSLVEERTRRLSDALADAEQQRGEAVRQSLRAEEANRSKSVFLASMSHELRTPLNSILGFGQLLERDPTLGADGRQQLAIIGRSGEHLLALINDVLSLSKIEAGRVELDEAAFDLHELLSELEEVFRVRAGTKDLEFRLEISEDVPRYVTGDERKLRQILLNLLSNALKFTTRGRVELRASQAGGRSTFEVEDTGAGMTGDEVSRLFEAFIQTETGKSASEGSGLGLVISRQFARLMGGDITVSSAPGKGTSFRVEVNLREAGAAGVSRGRRGKVLRLLPGQEPYRVLVVDDLLENRMLLARLLSAVGFEVESAVDGQEAVRLWKAFRPHLIWMDMRMPVMDGFAATRAIREAEALVGPATVRIVGLSATALEHDADAIRAAGCDDFLAKPFRESEVFEKMGELLGVRYVYEEVAGAGPGPQPVKPLTAARLGALPAELRASLHDALAMGDGDRARAIVDDAHALDEELAAALASALDRYEIDAVMTLLEKCA